VQPVEWAIYELHLDAVGAVERVAGGKMLGHASETQVEASDQVLAIMFGHRCAETPGKAPRVSFNLIDEIEHLFRREANQRLAVNLHTYLLVASPRPWIAVARTGMENDSL
jgi:hypothetical protein